LFPTPACCSAIWCALIFVSMCVMFSGLGSVAIVLVCCVLVVCYCLFVCGCFLVFYFVGFFVLVGGGGGGWGGGGGGIMHSAFSYLYLHDGILKLQYSCEDIAAQT